MRSPAGKPAATAGCTLSLCSGTTTVRQRCLGGASRVMAIAVHRASAWIARELRLDVRLRPLGSSFDPVSLRDDPEPATCSRSPNGIWTSSLTMALQSSATPRASLQALCMSAIRPVLQSVEGVPANEVTALGRAEPPCGEDELVTWHQPKLTVHGRWRRLAPPIEQRLVTTPDGELRWNCVMPRSLAQDQSRW